MKKTKIFSMIMTVATILSVATTSVYAMDYAEPVTSIIDEKNQIMLISETGDSDSISVILNGETVDFTDDEGNKVEPQLVNDRTMVPVRKIFEVLGATIEWDGDTNTVTATKDSKVMQLQIDNNIATVRDGNDIEKIELDAAPVIIDERTLVPARFISETLGLKVGWDEATQTVVIFDTHIILDIIKKEAPTFYAMMTEKTTNFDTAEAEADMTLTMNYKNSKDKKANTNIKVVCDGLLKIAGKTIGMDLTYKTTGKGSAYDRMKEEGLDNVSLKVAVDTEEPTVYVKSSLLESEIGTKWGKVEYDENVDLIELPNLKMKKENSEEELQEMVDSLFSMVTITPTIYEEVEIMTTLACRFISDDFFTVSGRTAKTYKYEISINDVDEIITDILGFDLELREFLKNTKLKFTSKYENGINTEATINLTGKVDMGDETIEFNADLKSVIKKVNQNLTVELPKDTVELKLFGEEE